MPNPVVGSIHVPGHANGKPQSRLRQFQAIWGRKKRVTSGQDASSPPMPAGKTTCHGASWLNASQNGRPSQCTSRRTPPNFKQWHSSQQATKPATSQTNLALPTLMHRFPPSGVRPRPSQVVIVSRLGLHMADDIQHLLFVKRIHLMFGPKEPVSSNGLESNLACPGSGVCG